VGERDKVGGDNNKRITRQSGGLPGHKVSWAQTRTEMKVRTGVNGCDCSAVRRKRVGSKEYTVAKLANTVLVETPWGSWKQWRAVLERCSF